MVLGITQLGRVQGISGDHVEHAHHELVGEPNVDRTRNLIKLYVLQSLRDEPRIEKVTRAAVSAEHDPPRETVRIELELRVLGAPDPLNLVVPFSLEVSL